jgi:hypothetical protein
MYMCKSEAKSNGASFGCAEYEAQEPRPGTSKNIEVYGRTPRDRFGGLSR